jgi:septum formation protein
MTQPNLILASTSTIRRQLMSKAGLIFAVVSPKVNEKAIKQNLASSTARELAAQLATLKALSIDAANTIIIGADQTLECEHNQFDKPHSIAEAKAQLMSLRGKTHYLHSGLSLVRNGRCEFETVFTATLHMRNFSDEFLETYLNNNQPQILNSVGAYLLEEQGSQLFSKIEGDYFTILGLPLLTLLDKLRDLGNLQI